MTDGPELFRERTRPPVWLTALLSVLLLAVLVPVLWGVFTEDAPGLSKALATVVSVGSLAATLFTYGSVSVRRTAVRIAIVPFWKKTIPLTSVARAVRTTARPLEFGGYGYRIKPGKRRALILRPGPAIRLETTSGTTYTIGTSQPVEFAAALRRAGTPVDRAN
ncbi:hypothetical protein GCM10027589_35690 [Actinocorallia lasiicapitis]